MREYIQIMCNYSKSNKKENKKKKTNLKSEYENKCNQRINFSVFWAGSAI